MTNHDDMTNVDETRSAQTAVFCADLHRHIDQLDGQASVVAARLRGLMDRSGVPDLGGSLHQKLRQLATERRRIMDLLATMGHRYPCSHR